jgi:peptidoglycan hydrolase-like protein with peptidoglycan-binding domain/DNA-binding XRE family transcriptional regulator
VTKNRQENHQPESHSTSSGDSNKVQTQGNHLLRMARRERSWSQGELAEFVGVAKETISRWENGVTRPQPNQLRKLREVFDKAPEELGYPIEPREEEASEEVLLPATLHNGPVLDEAERILAYNTSNLLDSSTVLMLKPMRRFHLRRALLGKMVLGGLLVGGVAAWLSNETFVTRNWPVVTFDVHRYSALVRVVQRMLLARQYSIGSSGVDGVFGPLTREAVISMQEDRHLPGSGKVDGVTWEVLILPSSLGSRGSQVIALQDCLRTLYPQSKLAVDGEFGPQTAGVVRQFRQEHQIPVRDEADLDTWCLLVGGTLPHWKWPRF